MGKCEPEKNSVFELFSRSVFYLINADILFRVATETPLIFILSISGNTDWIVLLNEDLVNHWL